MVITTFSADTTLTVLVLGRSTSIPDSRMGAVSIKIISSTNTTSTNGVTLISESEVWVRPFGVEKAIISVLCLSKVPLSHIQEFESEVVHHRAEFFDSLHKLIVSDDGRDGGKQTGRRRDQGLRYTRRHTAKRSRARGAESGEGVDN